MDYLNQLTQRVAGQSQVVRPPVQSQLIDAAMPATGSVRDDQTEQLSNSPVDAVNASASRRAKSDPAAEKGDQLSGSFAQTTRESALKPLVSPQHHSSVPTSRVSTSSVSPSNIATGYPEQPASTLAEGRRDTTATLNQLSGQPFADDKLASRNSLGKTPVSRQQNSITGSGDVGPNTLDRNAGPIARASDLDRLASAQTLTHEGDLVETGMANFSLVQPASDWSLSDSITRRLQQSGLLGSASQADTINVQVDIGAIQIMQPATPAKARSATTQKPPRFQPALTLSDYLEQRARGKR